MAKARNIGSGWHNESHRHSLARKTGKAGGAYASTRIRRILHTHPEYKKLTFKKLRNKGIYLKYKSDSDHDGVTNVHDCRPLDKTRQDDGKPTAGLYDRFKTEIAFKRAGIKEYDLGEQKEIEHPKEKKGFFEMMKEYKKEKEQKKEEKRESEHKKRQEEIRKLQNEIQELEEIKEQQRLAKKERETLSEVKKEKFKLKHEKAIRRLNALKHGLSTTGRFLKKEYVRYKRSKRPSGQKRKARKEERIFPTMKEIFK